MTDFVDVATLDDPTRQALRRHITTLADSKRLMGIRYSDWLLGAPSIETGIAASSMAQDEWGHARLLYSMLKELGDDPVAVEHDREVEAYANLGAVDAPFPDWAATVAAMVVVDPAVTAALASFADGRFEPAANRCPKMLAEEEFHFSLGRAWFRRLAHSGSDEARALLREATERMLPTVLQWLGAQDSASRLLEGAGLVGSAGARLEAFRGSVREILREIDIDVDGVSAEDGWDEERGRGPGHPDPEAVERARGDRNRALFVE